MIIMGIPTEFWLFGLTLLGIAIFHHRNFEVAIVGLGVILAYTVGYGGSMIWFGSSAGVAITNSFPEAKNTVRWLKEGWHIAPAYIIGFL